MNRQELQDYIKAVYDTEPEYPWRAYPEYAVFRHSSNRKWFAVIMNISKNKLGSEEDGIIDIVNLKCDCDQIGSLLGLKGFYPAYHMNKLNWISASLDGSVSDEHIKFLLEQSFEATDVSKRNK
jgi:predicted DNA-binding protein (MmcQ/YjbR family)